DIGTAAGAGARDDVGLAVAVEVRGRHVDPGSKTGIVSKEAGEPAAVFAAENADVGTAAGAGAADDVGEAIAVGVAGGHANAAREARIVGEEIVQQRVAWAAEDRDVRTAARVGSDDDVVAAIAID